MLWGPLSHHKLLGVHAGSVPLHGMATPELTVVDAGAAPAQWPAAQLLARALQAHLNSVGCPVESFQAFEDEVAALPGKYAPAQQGCLFLLCDGRCQPAAVIGMAALRQHARSEAEVKRMIVLPAARGCSGGLRLMAALAARAQDLGYATLVLDSLERLPHAVALYERCGFRHCEPYCFNPMPDAVYMRGRVEDVLKCCQELAQAGAAEVRVATPAEPALPIAQDDWLAAVGLQPASA